MEAITVNGWYREDDGKWGYYCEAARPGGPRRVAVVNTWAETRSHWDLVAREADAADDDDED
ncbi:MAG: hypothetical protein PVJ64_00360 [Gemmatimonadales bacterium]